MLRGATLTALAITTRILGSIHWACLDARVIFYLILQIAQITLYEPNIWVILELFGNGNVCYGNQTAVKTRANYDKKIV